MCVCIMYNFPTPPHDLTDPQKEIIPAKHLLFPTKPSHLEALTSPSLPRGGNGLREVK